MDRSALYDTETTALVSTIAAKLNAAIFDRSLFVPALNDFATFVGTHAASLEQIDLERKGAIIHGHVGIDDIAVREYVEHYHSINPRLAYAMNIPVGIVVSDLHMTPATGRSCHEFYDWVESVTDCAYTLGIKLEHNEDYMTVMGLHHVNENPLSDIDVKKRLLVFVPVLEQLNRSLKEYDRLQAAGLVGLSMMDSLSSGVALLGDNGLIVDANHPMREMLDESALLISISRCLTSPDNDVANQIIFALRSAANGTSQSLLLRDPLVGNLACTFLPSVQHGALAESDDRRFILLLVRGQERWDLTVGTLRELFDLTPRETGLAVALAQGKSLGTVAKEFCISPETARVHLRNIFAKTGTTRQGELISLLLTITTR